MSCSNRLGPSLVSSGFAVVLCCLLMFTYLVQAQFIHIFEVQDENRAPKSDLFDPAQYKYVSPAQLKKQQVQQPKPASQQQTTKPPLDSHSGGPTRASIGHNRARPVTEDVVSLNQISASNANTNNAYTSSSLDLARRVTDMAPLTTPAPILAPPTTATPTVQPGVTYMQPISRILANISANEIPERFEAELRNKIRMQQSENRYSRGTQPLRVSAQNQRQYVVRVPAPFQTGAGTNSANPMMPQQQLPPNLPQLSPNGQYSPVNSLTSAPTAHQTASSPRLSTLNSVISSPATSSADNGIPSSLLNSFLQRTQQQPSSQPQASIRQQSRSVHPQAQPPYTADLGASTYVTPPPQTPHQQPRPATHLQLTQSAPSGRSVNGVGNSNNAISLLQPPVTNKESLTDDDIRLIEEHNRKVRLFLQQRQAELASEQEQLRHQKAAEEAAAKAQQEAAEKERIRRLREEQEAAARTAAEQERIQRLKAEQEAAARAAAAEQERIQRLKAEQEAAARAAAEQERIRKLREQQEAAARIAAEQERIQRIRAEQERIRRLREEQEAAARAAAEQERIRRFKAEQEAAARAAAEQEQLRRYKAEQEAAARAAAEQEQLRRYKAEQEAAARAAAEQERIRRLKAEQEAAARVAAEQERIRKLREEQEAAARAAAEQEQLRRYKAEHEAAARAAAEQERIRRLKAEQEAAARAAADQERLRQLRAQQEEAIRLAESERQRRLRTEQEIAAIQMRYRNTNLPLTNISSNGLSYQPEPNLAIEDTLLHSRPRSNTRTSQDNTGLVDAARLRAEKEALAEQERLLRFQSSQQALAQQQASEQARLRRLREEEMLKAEEERAAREAQERQIIRARNEQNRLIHAARDAATRQSGSNSAYTPYTEDLVKYSSNYTNAGGPTPSYGSSLNNVRTPEPRGFDSSYRTSAASADSRSISSDYLRRGSDHNIYGNQTFNGGRNAAPSTDTTERTTVAPNFKAAKISLQELPPDSDADGIPGVAGRDYPTLTEIPKTSFSCARMPLNGYYADTETACQVVHMCQMGGVQDSFLCPNGTIWNQEKFACQWWYEVSCAAAPSFYELNNKLYKDGINNKPDKSSQPSRQA